jgi:hydrogenase maturation protease
VSPRKRIVIVGVGNILLKDEGIGVHVVRALQEMSLASPDRDVEVIDGGTSPAALDRAEVADRLIIVDAARGGGEPGTIYRFRPGDVSEEPKLLTSLHDLGILDTLRIMESVGKLPQETIIIAVEPAEVDWGLELTPTLKEKLPDIVRRVVEEQAASDSQSVKVNPLARGRQRC